MNKPGKTNLSRWAMLLLTLAPILSMYGTFLNYAIWSFLILVVYIVITERGKLILLPKFYYLYWIYLAFDYFIVSPKIGALVPGGVTFFVFSLILIFISREFNIEFYRRYMRHLVLISIILFFFQEITWSITDAKFVPVLPLGNLNTTMTYKELVARTITSNRPSSLFLEPAMFAGFLLLGLMVDLGSLKERRLLSSYSILIIFTLLLLRSGTALVGLGVLLIYYVTRYLKGFSLGKRIIHIIGLSALLGVAFSVYVKTEMGAEMTERSQNELTLDEEGHSYARFAVGTLIYNDLPLLNKILGASDETLLPIAKKYAFYGDNDANTLYMNGWASILTHTGLIGLILLLVVMIRLYKDGNHLSRSGIWLFAILSFFSSTYCQPIMLIVMIIATFYQHQNIYYKLNEK